MTQQIVAVAGPLGIAVHDHIIVGKDGHGCDRATAKQRAHICREIQAERCASTVRSEIKPCLGRANF
jgi:hypothetical protein